MQQIDIRHTFHIPTAAWNILVRPKIELLPLHLSQWLIRDKGWLFTVNSLLSMFQKRRIPSTFLCENSQQIGWTTNLQTCWWYGLNPEDDFETTKSFWGVWWRRVAFTQQKPWMGLLCYGQTMLGLPKCSCGVLVGGYVERSSKSAKWNSQGLLGFKLTLQTWREKKRRMRRLILEQVFKCLFMIYDHVRPPLNHPQRCFFRTTNEKDWKLNTSIWIIDNLSFGSETSTSKESAGHMRTSVLQRWWGKYFGIVQD